MANMFSRICLPFLFLLLSCASFAQATPYKYTWDRPVGFIKTSGFTAAPRGYIDFCKRHPYDCINNSADTKRIPLTLARMRELNTINQDVNDSLFFNSDLVGRDKWEYPNDGYGDCEDFVVEKRKRLIQKGWPAHALLISIVTKKYELMPTQRIHAVLVARTANGDYILDNEITAVVSWDKAARIYEYNLIQSEINPNVWALAKPITTKSSAR